MQILRASRVPAAGVSTWQEAVRLTDLASFAAVLFDIERPDDWGCVRPLRQQLPRELPIVALSAGLDPDGSFGVRNLDVLDVSSSRRPRLRSSER